MQACRHRDRHAERDKIQVHEFLLRLYIAGDSISSRRALDHVSRLQTSALSEGWKVEIIDVLAKPHLAEDAGILATPTLSYEHPSGSRRIVGDLSDASRILSFLGIVARDEKP